MAILDIFKQWRAPQQPKPIILIYYPFNGSVDLFEKLGSPYCRPVFFKDFNEFLQQKVYDPTLVWVYGASRAWHALDKGSIQRRLVLIKDRYPQAKIIASDLHMTADAFLHAGADFFLDAESGYFGSAVETKSAFGLGNGFHTLPHSMLQHVVRIINTVTEQKIQEVVEEKSRFYELAKDLIAERSQKTANLEKEKEFLDVTISKLHSHNILDCGCGYGRLSNALAKSHPNWRLHGIDLSDANISVAIRGSMGLQNATYYVKDILGWTEGDDRTFDAVYMLWHVVCEFKEHQWLALKNTNRILKVGGLLIFDIPDAIGNTSIDASGTYVNDTPFGKYVGRVPQLKQLFFDLECRAGFHQIRYFRVNWGIPKFVVIAWKHGLTW